MLLLLLNTRSLLLPLLNSWYLLNCLQTSLLLMLLLLHSASHRLRHASLHGVIGGWDIAAPRVLVVGLRTLSFCLISCT